MRKKKIAGEALTVEFAKDVNPTGNRRGDYVLLKTWPPSVGSHVYLTKGEAERLLEWLDRYLIESEYNEQKGTE